MVRTALRLFLLMFVLAAVIILAAPSILSTDWGKRLAIGLIDKKIPGHLEIDRFHIGWFGPQKIAGITLTDPDGTKVLTIGELSADGSLMHLLRSPMRSGDITLDGLNVNVQVDEQGYSNLERSLFADCCEKTAKDRTQNPVTISLQNFHGHLHFPKGNNPLELDVQGESRYNDQSGNISLQAELSEELVQQLIKGGKSATDALKKAESGDVVVKAKIEHFPTALIDQFLILTHSQYAGAAKELLGDTLDIELNQSMKDGGALIALRGKSPRSSLSGDMFFSEAITLLTPLEINIAISPSFVKMLQSPKEESEAMITPMPTATKITINQMHIPLEGFTNRSALKKTPFELQATISQLPFTLFVSNDSARKVTQKIIGNSLDLSTAFHSDGNSLTGTVTLHGSVLAPIDIDIVVAEKTQIVRPVIVTLAMDPTLLSTITSKPLPIALRNTAKVDITLDSFELPLSFDQMISGKAEISLDDVNYTAKMSASPLQFSGNSSVGTFVLQDLFASTAAKNGNVPIMNISGSILQSEGSGYFKSLLGENTWFQGTLTGYLLRGDFAKDNDFTLNIGSSLIASEIEGTINLESGIRLTKPGTIKYTLAKEAIEQLGLNKMADGFQAPTTLDVAITSLKIPANLENLTHLKINGSLAIDTLAPASKQASLDEIKTQWVVDGSGNVIALDFHGLTRFGHEAAGKVNGSIVMEHWIKDNAIDFSHASIRTTFNARRLPTEILAFNYGGNDVAQILGNMIDITISAKLNDLIQTRGTALITLRSDNISGGISLAFDDHIHLSNPDQPAIFQLTLTPEGHAAIRNLLKKGYDDPFQLTEPSKISFIISSVDGPLPFSFVNTAFKGAMEIDQLIGIDKRTQQKLSLDSISANIVSPNLLQEFNFTMSGHGQAVYGKPTSINVKGSIYRPFTNDGKINTNDLSLKVDGTLVSIPAPLLCKVMCSNALLSHQSDAIFGPTLDASIMIQLQHMNGPIVINASGTNGNFSLNAQIQDGVLSLNEDLQAQVVITPQLGQYVLQEYIPITNGILSSDQPLKITIDKKGFSMPIKEISPLAISLGTAKIDFGKVKFSSQSQLAKALSLLTPPNAETIMVWLTPIYLSMNSGIVKLERVDMLLNDLYPLAAWGTVNLEKEKVDMVIGLSGAAIASVFNVPSVPKSYILQVPFKGPLNGPSLDKTRAVARLSALTAQMQGGPHGMLIGSALDILSGGLKEALPPKPTTQPLPWQKMMIDDEKPAGSNEKIPLQGTVEDITKEAGSILRKILKK